MESKRKEGFSRGFQKKNRNQLKCIMPIIAGLIIVFGSFFLSGSSSFLNEKITEHTLIAIGLSLVIVPLLIKSSKPFEKLRILIIFSLICFGLALITMFLDYSLFKSDFLFIWPFFIGLSLCFFSLYLFFKFRN